MKTRFGVEKRIVKASGWLDWSWNVMMSSRSSNVNGNMDWSLMDGILNRMGRFCSAYRNESVGPSVRIRPVIDAVSDSTATHVEVNVTSADSGRNSSDECQENNAYLFGSRQR